MRLDILAGIAVSTLVATGCAQVLGLEDWTPKSEATSGAGGTSLGNGDSGAASGKSSASGGSAIGGRATASGGTAGSSTGGSGGGAGSTGGADGSGASGGSAGDTNGSGGESGSHGGSTSGSDGNGGSTAGGGGTSNETGGVGGTAAGSAGQAPMGGMGGSTGGTGGAGGAGAGGASGTSGSAGMPNVAGAASGGSGGIIGGCDNQLLANADFEAGPSPSWTQESDVVGLQIIVPKTDSKLMAEGVAPYAGNYLAWLGGIKDDMFDRHDVYLTQAVTIPAEASSLTLTGRYYIKSDDDPAGAYDVSFLEVSEDGEVLWQGQYFSNQDETNSWQAFSSSTDDTTLLAGKTLTFVAYSRTDLSGKTSFFLDNLRLEAGCGR